MNKPFESTVKRIRQASLFVLFRCCLSAAGCGRREAAAPELEAKVAVQFSPNPPVVGKNDLEITLTDPVGKPLRLGRIQVEGNMNHAGMKPVFVELAENEPGKYAGAIEFTMGGDWFLLLSAEPSPEGRLNKKVDVPGVEPK
jgi:hypothetical protein